jgi:uncharacterized protein (TIGR00369 family)
MTAFTPLDPGFAERVRASFGRKGVMALLGARLLRVEPGEVAIELPWRADLSQQHGYFHGGITSTIADSAGGYAGFTLFPADASVLTVEFKINLLSPAKGDRLVAVGRVIKTGRTLTVCNLEVDVYDGDVATPCAYGLQTLIRLVGRSDGPAS